MTNLSTFLILEPSGKVMVSGVVLFSLIVKFVVDVLKSASARVSIPAPPSITLIPVPPVMKSSPSPPLIESFPALPSIVSFPAPPFTVSFPPPVVIVSPYPVPVI